MKIIETLWACDGWPLSLNRREVIPVETEGTITKVIIKETNETLWVVNERIIDTSHQMAKRYGAL